MHIPVAAVGSLAILTMRLRPTSLATPDVKEEPTIEAQFQEGALSTSARWNPYATPTVSLLELSPNMVSEDVTSFNPESGPGDEITPVVFPPTVEVDGPSSNIQRTERTLVIDTTMTLPTTYTDNAAAKSEPRGMHLLVPVLVLAAYFVLVLIFYEMIGWGARMDHTSASRPLIAPLGKHLVHSRVLIMLSNVAGALVSAAVLAVWASGRTVIERAARRPILPVFLEAVHSRQKLSKAVVRPGWRATVLGVGTVFGVCAGAALIVAADVEPATRVQHALYVTVGALLNAWSICYMLSVGSLEISSHKLPTFALLFGVVITFAGVSCFIVAYGLFSYYVASCSTVLTLFGLFIVFSSVAWRNRNERVALLGVW
eukprot:IDg1850t1